ncbi:DUF2865 domain-containing protein [Maritalea mediterranea]|uniref:DUF2865 domain-containing protein n=1 Tax=Maritalea mediterranea TaxID=2909667 RepID=A0ABS9E595_9HYPH|nr:DUF2865 domain-containing protein [Maritalea mediterranea]MCF4098033.1 DUF2865 domain-containing protein [Maritalea mediterranea]
MLRFATLVVFCFSVLLPQTMAFAQSDSCRNLQRQIRSFERDRDFRNYRENYNGLREKQKEVKAWESQFVRRGCQKALNAGKRLDSTCRSIGRKIQRERDNFNSLRAKVQQGAEIAQAREQALQQYARFSCGDRNSGRTINNREPERKSLFERIFGSRDDNGIIEQDYYDLYNRETYRTVCARSCDGFYWPVSFSTLPEYLPDDQAVCQGNFRQGDVKLYYYSNTDGSPETMVDMNGTPYSESPNAFRYRQVYDEACQPQQAATYGKIELSEGGDSSKAIISFGEVSFPLPRRDPRKKLELEVTTASFIPLPRPDPRRENGGSNVQVTAASSYSGLRLVNFGDKTVRIVGPDTPYVPKVGEGS